MQGKEIKAVKMQRSNKGKMISSVPTGLSFLLCLDVFLILDPWATSVSFQYITI